MSILDRLKSQPPWRDPDPLVRIDGIDEIPDEEQDLLGSLAREDEDAHVREAAVSRVQDHGILADIIRSDSNAGVKAAAAEALRDIAVGAAGEPDEARCLAALEGLTDLKQVALVAKQSSLDAVGLAALARLTEPKALGAIAKNSGQTVVRLEAASRVDDPSELASIARNSEHKDSALAALERITDGGALKSIAGRAKSKIASRRARSMLRALEEEAEQPSPEELAERLKADQSALCRRLESSATADGEPDEQHLADALARAESQWAVWAEQQSAQQPDQTTDPDLVQRFDTACAKARTRLAELSNARQEREQRAAERAQALEPYTAVCITLESLTSDTEPAADRLTEAKAAWEALPGLEGSDTTELAARYAAVCATLEAALEAVASEHGRLERLEALVTEIETLAGTKDGSDTLANWTRLRRDLAVVRGDSELPDELSARLAAVEPTFETREAEHRDAEAKKQQQQLGRLRQIADRLEKLLTDQDLTLKAAERAQREVRSTIDQLTGTGKKGQATTLPRRLLPTKQDRDAMLERLRAIQTALPLKLEDLRQADDWLRWANAGVQEQLCGRMEALLEQDDLKDAARQVRVLQQEWKKVKTASRDRSEALWHRFKDAQDAVRERCKPLFAKQAEEKAEHLKRKEELCEKAELLADSTDWIRTADTIKKLQAEWKTIGPAFQEKATWERFRAACDRFFTRRKRDLAERRTTWAANLAAKVALCEQVEAIADMPELEATAAQLIRKLQADWKALGPVQRSRSDAIWKRFRTACDRFFDRHHGRDPGAQSANLAEREAVCTELEALLPAADAETPADAPEGLADQVRALRQRWKQAGSVPRAKMADLTDRVDRTLQRLATVFPAGFKGTDLDLDANVTRLEKLCDRVEAFIKEEVDVSSVTSLAERLKEALASNTIGGKTDDEAHWRTATESVKDAQNAFRRVRPVPAEAGAALTKRFRQACDRFFDERRKQQPGQARGGR